MNQSTQNTELPDPFADVYANQHTVDTAESVSFRLGEKLGQAFLALKRKVNRKYQAIAEGIHHQVEAEAEMERLAQEQWLQAQLDTIAAEYHSQLKHLRIRYTVISVAALLIGIAV